MSEKIAAYADSLGLPTTQAGQIEALRVAGVPREAILPSLEDDSRIPAYCLKPIEAAQGGGEDPDPEDPEDPEDPLPPEAFAAEDWSVADTETGFQVTIVSLPEDNGEAITAVEYKVDDGAWTDAGVTSGAFDVAVVPGEYQVALRAVNSAGAGETSDLKPVTVVAPDPEEPEDPTAPLAFENADWTLAATPSGFSITIVSLPEDGGSAIQGVEYQVDTEDWVNLNSLESGEVTADPGEYQVRIRCFNSVGNSPDSEYKAVTVEVA